MNANIYQEIENNPRFKELVNKRSRFHGHFQLLRSLCMSHLSYLLRSIHNG